eukprot:231390-Hanusia_phi.AAC.1
MPLRYYSAPSQYPQANRSRYYRGCPTVRYGHRWRGQANSQQGQNSPHLSSAMSRIVQNQIFNACGSMGIRKTIISVLAYFETEFLLKAHEEIERS